MKLSNAVSIILFTGCVAVPGFCQTPPHSESQVFNGTCHEVAERARACLSEHGVFTLRQDGLGTIAIRGRESEPITARSLANGVRRLKLWTDGHGKQITDVRVYWDLADRNTGDKLPVGMWRLRLAHHTPAGNISLTPSEGGCFMNIAIQFRTNGANMIAILVLDSVWGYNSNGRLEREYLDGISDALQKSNSNVPRTEPHP